MKVLTVRNVNEAYKRGLQLLKKEGERQTSRAGDVIVAPYPVVTAYYTPTERVLFDPIRDANPFFHLMESLWMLAGRNDATWLDQFISTFSSRFAENDGIQHGAYGFRWRSHFLLDDDAGKPDEVSEGFELDQLNRIVRMLSQNPNDRRVVLQMWDPEIDLGANKNDVPCNLCVLPRIVSGKLDITVTCRSNDAIWGAYGANAVHFSVLQEYLARRLNLDVGMYYQISNNFHAYVNVFKTKAPSAWLENNEYVDYYDFNMKNLNPCITVPMIMHPDAFDDDLKKFFDHPTTPDMFGYKNPFFEQVVLPMFYSYKLWRAGEYKQAFDFLDRMPVHTCDWYIACRQWFERRYEGAASSNTTAQ